jgi:molybdopterin synthase sulfur carrier subunit
MVLGRARRVPPDHKDGALTPESAYRDSFVLLMIRVILPQHLRTLAHVGSELTIEVKGQATLRSVLDALEARYPMLRGTIRDHGTQQRRPFLRFFACEEDLSHEPPDAPLPDAVASGKEPLVILGAIAGG